MNIDLQTYYFMNNQLCNKLLIFEDSILSAQKNKSEDIFCQLLNIEKKISISLYFNEYLLLKCVYCIITKNISLELLENVQQLYNAKNYSNHYKSIFLLYKGVYLRNILLFDESSKIIKDAIRIASNEDIIGLCYYHLGILNEYMNNILLSYKYSSQAEDIFKRTLNYKRLLFSKSHIGILYGKLGNYEYSNIIFNEVLKASIKYAISDISKTVDNNIAWNFFKAKKNNELIDFLSPSKINQNTNYCFFLSWAYYKTKNYNMSKKLIKQYVDNQYISDLCRIRLLVISELIKNKLSEPTLCALKNLHELSLIQGDSDSLDFSISLLSNYYELIHHYKEALFYSNQITMVKYHL